jgi:hypothetical protein
MAALPSSLAKTKPKLLNHQPHLLNRDLPILLAKGLGIWHRSSINHYYRLFLYPCSGSVFVELGFQLTSHLQSNTLELDDKAQTLSYEHYCPYGGTAIIASKDKTQAQQKRYRYTGKERNDSSGLCYYGYWIVGGW